VAQDYLPLDSEAWKSWWLKRILLIIARLLPPWPPDLLCLVALVGILGQLDISPVAEVGWGTRGAESIELLICMKI